MNRKSVVHQYKSKVCPGIAIKTNTKAGSMPEDGGNFWGNMQSLYKGLFNKLGIKCCGVNDERQ